MGALCCVAARPQGEKSNAVSQEFSMDPSETHWRDNSSFSPPFSRRWDHRLHSDGLSQETHGTPVYGSSLSPHSKRSRNGVNSDQYTNHQYSVSDGALSFLDSPSDILQAPRWIPPVQRYDLGEFMTPAGGTRLDSTAFPQNEIRFTARASSMSNTTLSPSPLSESSRCASSSKQSSLLPPRNVSGRRSFMSKPVYPLVLRNPVSDDEAGAIAGPSTCSRMIPCDNSKASSPWMENTYIPHLKFHKSLSDFEKVGTSPGTNRSSKREGFRWSNASSCDLGFDGEPMDITERIDLENHRSPNCSVRHHKCGLCNRMLWQKSPWSAQGFVRNSDLPIAGVLPCAHVFHSDCLEETTPKSQVHEPPCPLCRKLVPPIEGSPPFSEPLQVALRTLQMNQGADSTSSYAGNGNTRNEGDLKQNQSQPVRGSSSMRGHLRKRLSSKGKMVRNRFGAKLFRKNGSSSSSLLGGEQNQTGRLQFRK